MIMETRMPKIVCLCGSLRFKEEFAEVELKFIKEGCMVLLPSYMWVDAERDEDLCVLKPLLDELHKRKIDLADEILVINKDDYVGDSTRSEILYAVSKKKSVRFLEPESLTAKLFSTNKSPSPMRNKIYWFLLYYTSKVEFKKGNETFQGKITEVDIPNNTIHVKTHDKTEHKVFLDKQDAFLLLKDVEHLSDRHIDHIALNIIGVTPHLYGEGNQVQRCDIRNFISEGDNSDCLTVSSETYEILLHWFYKKGYSVCLPYLTSNKIAK